MPLWDIQASPSLLSAEEKRALAHSLGQIYLNAGLPAFYINVRFTDRDNESWFNGGETPSKLVLIRVEHLARSFRDHENKRGFFQKVDEILVPLLKPKGALWEIAVTEVDRTLWEINGIVPPLPGTEMEKKWKEMNWPVEYNEGLEQNGG